MAMANGTNERIPRTTTTAVTSGLPAKAEAAIASAGPTARMPLTVAITVVRPRRLDSDNAVGAAKHVRDAIAAWVGVDDGDLEYTWVYRQSRGPHAVLIEIRESEAGDGSIVLVG